MPDWLTAPFASPGVPWRVLVVRLVTAALFGLAVATIYRRTRDPERMSRSFPGTLVLLCVIIAMVTQVIGDNVALAFSLVGALSIVRFRTAVQDTIDTAFVILAVAAGMAIGAGHLAVAAGGTAVAGAVAWLVRDTAAPRAAADRRCLLDVRMGWAPEGERLVREALAAHDPLAECVAAGTAKKGAVLELSYRMRMPRGASLGAVVAAIRAVESVQGVEVRIARGDG